VVWQAPLRLSEGELEKEKSMAFPPPTMRQARVLWFCLTALAVGVFLGLMGLLVMGFGLVLKALSGVLLPLAIAGVLAYILDPVVDYLEDREVGRVRAIVMVFVFGLVLVALMLATVLPQLIFQIGELVARIPDYTADLNERLSNWTDWAWIQRLPEGLRPLSVWEAHGSAIQEWVAQAVPVITGWALAQFSRMAAWLGFVVGIFLVPIYVFYFLLQKRRIVDHWTEYLPIQESRVKEETVFVLRSINDSLIVFFRGQVLVALCVGVLTAVGFTLIGLRYALLLGVITGVLGIIPYLGVMVSIVPAIVLGIVQFGDWRVFLVVGVFALVQTLESWVISPKIIGDRVGMHPLTIIIAIMVGTTLMGGILGGVLAIPLTAALRTLMFRYVWRKRPQSNQQAAGAGPETLAAQSGY
jgi:predicted PurR-regulated permease PerM